MLMPSSSLHFLGPSRIVGRMAAPIRLSFLVIGLGLSNSIVAVTAELNEDDDRQDKAVEGRGRWGDLGGKGHLRLWTRRVLMPSLVVDCRRLMMSTSDFLELSRQVELRFASASRGVSVSVSCSREGFSVGDSNDDVFALAKYSSSSSGIFSIIRLLTSGSFAAFGGSGSVGIRGSLLGACS